MSKPYLAAAALIAGVFAIFYLAFSAERVVPLVPLTDPPRPPVKADPKSTHTTLSGRRPTGIDKSNESREARNALVKAHQEALAAWRAGTRTLREVESIEMDLLLARHRIREIDDAALHSALVTLYTRELERLTALHAKGLASQDHIELARLYLARERHLAGAEEGQNYEVLRTKFLADTKARHERLIKLRVGKREHLAVEYDALVEEFGPEVRSRARN